MRSASIRPAGRAAAVALVAATAGFALTGCGEPPQAATVPSGTHITGGSTSFNQTHGWSVGGAN
ncbi:hypothetical protein ELQ92_06065 [Labedella populi]|uniref:Uncharacterized protein n=1 Tax=Labedella populi TaxID=2498850 RepID=A0A3S3ZTH7_9MICO|nr:hypothetical protein [Labedella populi]RWZ64331.1 hypothetical protein ELQ92_06065 [Labedella populi]